MLDFEPRHFTSSFNSSPYYNGNLNGFDILIMDSSEATDEIILKYKKIIDDMVRYGYNELILNYDREMILESDQYRIKCELERYGALKGIRILDI